MSPEEIIVLRCPLYLNDPRIPSFIELAKLRTSQNVFGIHYDNAVALRTLHLMSMTDRVSDGNYSPGSISSEREGNLSRSYNKLSNNSNSSDLSQSIWGVELQDLIHHCVIGISNRMISNE